MLIAGAVGGPDFAHLLVECARYIDGRECQVGTFLSVRSPDCWARCISASTILFSPGRARALARESGESCGFRPPHNGWCPLILAPQGAEALGNIVGVGRIRE